MRALVPLLLLLLAAGVVRADPPEVSKEENDPYPAEFRKRVDEAVDRGVEHLLAQQQADGLWPAANKLQTHRLGVTALCTLACLAGGVRANDAHIERAFEAMRPMPLKKTYDVGVLLMALHARYAAHQGGDEEIDRYGRRVIKDPCSKKMSKADREWMQAGVDFLLKHQKGGHWRYPEDGVDLSNTQYALLGLWAASRCGLKIPQQVWLDSLEWLQSVQETTGRSVKLLVNEVRGKYRVAWTENARARGFRYQAGSPVTAAMTTAGLAGLAICQDELWASRKFTAKMRKDSRRSIRDAVAWMQDNFDVTKNRGEPTGGWHYYFLYGLERAGILTRMRFMGSHDWYKEGAEYLLENQGGSGQWTREHVDLDTAFAILFLKRSTSRTRNPAITPR